MATIDAALEHEQETVGDSQWPEFAGYKPLNRSNKEIRLLRISTSSKEALPKCELLHHSLEDEPPYYALSYHWGAPGETAAILVDGNEVQVRETLHCFLRRLTSHINPITVWLDAICINQKDVEERNWQVQLMPEIYQGAQNVYAWLGEGDADCLFAMRYVSTSKNAEQDNSTAATGLASEYLQRLFLLPYWSRVWIIQELVLAKALWLLCNNQLVRWEDLVTAFDRVLECCRTDTFPHTSKEANATSSLSLSRFNLLKKTRNSNDDEGRSLVELVKLFREHDCTDQRDKFFGLLGLASNSDQCIVDYSQTLPYVFLRSLSPEIATVTRGGPKSRDGPFETRVEAPGRGGARTRHSPNVASNWNNQKLSACITLCSHISMMATDICAMLGSNGSHSMLEWLTYDGAVTSVSTVFPRPIERLWDRIKKNEPSDFLKVIIRDRYKATQIMGIPSPQCRKGDLVYSLWVPDIPTSKVPIAFRYGNGCFRAVDVLVDSYPSPRPTLEERDNLRIALIGRVELCSANALVPPAGGLNKDEVWGDAVKEFGLGVTGLRKPDLQMVQASVRLRDVALAHISYDAMLALTAFSMSYKVPDYLRDLDNEPQAETRLCKGGDSPFIDVQTSDDGAEQTLSASWSCCYGSE